MGAELQEDSTFPALLPLAGPGMPSAPGGLMGLVNLLVTALVFR